MERSNSGVLSKHLHSARQSTPDPRITEEVFPCSEFWDELRGSAAKIIRICSSQTSSCQKSMAALPVKNTGPFYFQFRVLPPSPLNQLTTVALFCLILLESQDTGAALGLQWEPVWTRQKGRWITSLVINHLTLLLCVNYRGLCAMNWAAGYSRKWLCLQHLYVRLMRFHFAWFTSH